VKKIVARVRAVDAPAVVVSEPAEARFRRGVEIANDVADSGFADILKTLAPAEIAQLEGAIARTDEALSDQARELMPRVLRALLVYVDRALDAARALDLGADVVESFERYRAELETAEAAVMLGERIGAREAMRDA